MQIFLFNTVAAKKKMELAQEHVTKRWWQQTLQWTAEEHDDQGLMTE